MTETGGGPTGRVGPARTVLDGLDAVRAAVGQHLGHSDWVLVDQAVRAQFAAAIGAEGEDGFLLLSLSNRLLPQIVEVRGVSLGVNYGTGQVRFPAPLPAAGGRVRAGAELVAADDVAGGVQTTMRITIDSDAGDLPAATIESLSRYLA